MNQRRAGFFAVLLIGVLLFSSLISYVNAAGAGQNDAGLGRDASDTKLNSPTLLNSGRYLGQLVTSTDTQDWYTFKTPSGAGRAPVEILLQSLTGNNVLSLELHDGRQEVTAPAAATGAGGAGVWAIERSLSPDTNYWIRVQLGQGGITGRYELALSKHTENDANQPKDGDAGNEVSLGDIAPRQSLTFEGNLTTADTEDRYRFRIPEGNSVIIAGVHHTPTASLTASLSPIGTAPNPTMQQQRSGPGFAAAYQPNANSDAAGREWRLTVSRSPTTSTVPYSVTLAIQPDNSPDPGKPAGQEASADTTGAEPITQGSHRATLVPSQGDIRDVYKLQNVAVGEIIHVGASANTGDVSRPVLGLVLYRAGGTGGIEMARVSPCRTAAGISLTATHGGDWFVEVVDQSPGGGGCTQQVALRDGEYAISYRLLKQRENGAADAPASIDQAPMVPPTGAANDVFSEAWMDSTDVNDMFKLGDLVAGQGVRVGATTDVPGMEYSIQLFRNATLVATSTSTSGTGRINSAVGVNGTYFVRFDYHAPTEGAPPLGFIHFYAAAHADESPTAVTLLEINRPATGGGDVTRSSVTVRWSRSVDDDFQRYEVHAGLNQGYTPSSGTLKQTITNRDTTQATVEGLRSDTSYEFVVRVVDQSGHQADSNRRTTTTRSGPLSNTAPTLDGGGVSPSSGTTSTLFKFQVNYTDADNDPPTRAQVVISGTRSNMVAQETTYSEGALFIFETTLTAGTKDFFFEFSDGQTAGDARDPRGAGSYTGPTVAQGGNRPPTAAASANRTDGDAPLAVRFDVAASDPDGDALTYSWDFDTSNGVQSDSSQKSPQHTYTRRGVYTAVVFVRDSRGAESSDSLSINVRGSANEAPSVNAQATPSEGEAPLTVQFSANAQDADGTIVSYKWDFDNSNGLGQDSTVASPTFTYTKAGSFVATVTVRDNGSAETVDSVTVVVRTAENGPPSILVTADPVEGSAPLVVNFSATATDPDGETVIVEWDFDTSNEFQVEATGFVASHTYETTGEFTAMAIARDPNGATATGTTTIRVLAGGASSVFIVAEPSSGKAPLAVNFRADTSGMVAAAETYEWDFGDGGTGTGREVIHTYEKPGSYGVILIVTDENGGKYESTATIRVQGGGSPGLGPAFAIALVVAVAFVLHRRRQGPK